MLYIGLVVGGNRILTQSRKGRREKPLRALRKPLRVLRLNLGCAMLGDDFILEPTAIMRTDV